MKRSRYTTLLMLVFVMASLLSVAQSYNITTSSKWSSVLPALCANCTNPMFYGSVTLNSGGTEPGNALPVVLIGFSAVLHNDKMVSIEWNTQMEVNTSRFILERNADGNSWTEAGVIRAKGNSSIQTDYSFTNEHPLAGTNFYRLRMVDLDNSFGYTEVKVVSTSIVNSVSFFPNPARDYVNVSLGSGSSGSSGSAVMVTVRLINTAGQVLTGVDGFRESRQLLISRS